MIDGWGISSEIALIWMPLDSIDDQSTLVQVMACCRQATSHYLIQCWPSSMSPYGVTRSQWVKNKRTNNSSYKACILPIANSSIFHCNNTKVWTNQFDVNASSTSIQGILNQFLNGTVYGGHDLWAGNQANGRRRQCPQGGLLWVSHAAHNLELTSITTHLTHWALRDVQLSKLLWIPPSDWAV